jgi:hypothetical protein
MIISLILSPTLSGKLTRINRININSAGTLTEYCGSSTTAILYSELFRSLKESDQLKHARVAQIGMENETVKRKTTAALTSAQK